RPATPEGSPPAANASIGAPAGGHPALRLAGRVTVMARIAPSILSADFAALAASIDEIAPEADLLHVDVMDGHFVPNLTIAPPLVRCIRGHTDLYLDCHLMMTNPGDFLEAFAKAGPNACSV